MEQNNREKNFNFMEDFIVTQVTYQNFTYRRSVTDKINKSQGECLLDEQRCGF
jgi:hypothetical protein